MKIMLESFAIFLVGILSLLVVFLIVQYNMIEEDTIEYVSSIVASQEQADGETKTSAYLSSLEGYGDDVDVKVDAKKEDHTNEVAVKSELNKDDLGRVVEDKSKTSYTENLEHYAKEAEKKPSEPTKSQKDPNVEKVSSDEPEKLPQEEIDDEIGKAIDAALDDL